MGLEPKKANAHVKKLEWNEIQANDFLKCSRGYSETTSKLVVDIHIWADLYTRKESDWEKKGSIKNDEIIKHINFLKLLNWEIKRFSQAAQETKEKMLKKEEELFKAQIQLIAYCKNPDGQPPFSFETIRELQIDFDKITKEVHAELCGIKG